MAKKKVPTTMHTQVDGVSNSVFWFSPCPQLVIDPFLDRIEAANSEACNFIGIGLNELKSLSVSKLFDEAFPSFVVFTEEVLTNGVGWSDFFHIHCFDKGEKIRVELSAKINLSRVGDADQLKIQLVFQNADELAQQRSRADAQRHYLSGLGQWARMSKVFQEFERENRLILDAAGEGIYGVDAEGCTTFLNPAAESLLGWQAEELIGKNIHAAIHSRHADGSHYHVGDCPIYRAFREGIVTNVDDEVFWTKEGRSIHVEYTSTPIKDNGHVVGAVVIFRDVTEKKLAQSKLLDALQEVERLKQKLEMENAYLQEEINSEFNYHQIVGKSSAIKSIIQKIELVAPTDATVLINGESGTGKELIARAIHDLSSRGQRSLIRVNCAAIPADLFESEFFGHCKGAFTGATTDRPGRFELADGGTLFLDEVGEIPLSLQGKLLRVLQEQQFERVGESKTRKVDVRILAATNRDLKRLVATGEFREDLYFRLNVFPVESVPLRQRLDDIPVLAQHFLQRALARTRKTNLKISLGQLEKLKNYDWPGNIRELENVIERQVILARGDSLRFDDLVTSGNVVRHSGSTPNHEAKTEDELKEQQKRNLLLALQKCNGRIFGEKGAAKLLGMRPTTLASRIKKYQIDVSMYKNDSVYKNSVA